MRRGRGGGQATGADAQRQGGNLSYVEAHVVSLRTGRSSMKGGARGREELGLLKTLGEAEGASANYVGEKTGGDRARGAGWSEGRLRLQSDRQDAYTHGLENAGAQAGAGTWGRLAWERQPKQGSCRRVSGSAGRVAHTGRQAAQRVMLRAVLPPREAGGQRGERPRNSMRRKSTNIQRCEAVATERSRGAGALVVDRGGRSWACACTEGSGSLRMDRA